MNKSGKALVQEANTGAARQQWSITKTSRGTYVIRPRSGTSYSKDWCMCAGSNLFGITDGLNVEQKEYDDDNSLKDEWYLYDVYDVTLLGVNDTDNFDRQAYMSPTRAYYEYYYDSDVYTEYYYAYSVSDMIQCMQRSSIFYIHTHGLRDRVYISTSNQWLTMSNLNGVDLSNTEFMFMLTCDTGQGGYNQANVNAGAPTNIVEQLVYCGAETVIGFRGETSPVDCNWYAETFTKYALEGYEEYEGDYPEILSVYGATEACKRNLEHLETTYLTVIGGNANKFLG